MTTQTRFGAGAAAGVGILFASNGAIFAALLPWYPLLAVRLSLDVAEFGVIVAAFALGAIASSALPTPLVARFGPVPVGVGGTVLLALVIAGAAWATTGWMLAAFIFLAGFVDAVVDVAQNLAGIRVQDVVGRSILSSMHALWSLGGVVSGALSTVAAAAGIDARLYLAAVGITCILLVAVGGRLVGASANDADAPAPRSPGGLPRAGLLHVALPACLPLVALAICGTMLEDVANNWAAMAAVSIGGLPLDSAGIAFTVVLGSQCVGRFSGDLLIQRFGRATVARYGGFLIASGGLLVVTTQGQAGTLLLGLAMAGYGSATLVPSALSAAGSIPGVSAGVGVTLVSWLMRLGFLGTSPVVGALADATDLRWGLCILVAVGVTAAVLSRALDRPARGAGASARG